MRLTRWAVVVIALLSLAAAGCQQLRELSALQSKIAQEFGTAPDNVLVSSKGRLNLSFATPRYFSLPEDKQLAEATRIARFAWKNCPGSIKVNSVRVVFSKKLAFGPLSKVDSKGFDFTAQELSGEPAAPGGGTEAH